MGAQYWAPGLECADPREMHNHRCAACGDITLWSHVACQAMDYVPPCGACGVRLWVVTVANPTYAAGLVVNGRVIDHVEAAALNNPSSLPREGGPLKS